MAKIRLNLDDYGNSFEPIPEGEYDAYLYNVEATTFSSGNPGFKLTFKIAEGPYKGRQVFDNLVIKESAYWKLAQFWRAMTGETGVVEVDTDRFTSFVGSRVRLRIAIEEQEYQGETQKRNVVRNMKYIGGTVNASEDLNDMLFNREPVAVGADDDVPF